MRLFPCLIAALVSSAAAAQPGIWLGSGKKDPITDKPTSLSYMASASDEADVVVRCRSDGLDLLLDLRRPAFQFGERVDVLLRAGSRPATKTVAAAVSSKTLALEPDRSIYSALRDGDLVAVRFAIQRGPEVTLEFRPAMKENARAKVGRPLADCGLEPTASPAG